jgi:two-component system, NarL family, response regulator LiaR
MGVTDAPDTTAAPDPEWPGRSKGLSKRESDVLALLAQGLTNREIAEAMYLSHETVKGYVAQIYSKLGVRNRVEANRFVHRSGEFAE